MANSNGWGDGAVNNLIGWGQGAINNAIGWGSVYANSFSGKTDILGSLAVILTNAFKIRVTSDSGIFEAESCLNTILTNLNNI